MKLACKISDNGPPPSVPSSNPDLWGWGYPTFLYFLDTLSSGPHYITTDHTMHSLKAIPETSPPLAKN